MPLWGKVRIHGGDAICTTLHAVLHLPFYRQYDISYAQNDTATPMMLVCYGSLKKILVCEVDDGAIWKDIKESVHILALIKPY
ncbi:hypothetical protein BS17DRAFT_701729 [Gyrodon lividus]|nr:hypothetical protein BS17DRAFT_701729 [Gyrodon lividus]